MLDITRMSRAELLAVKMALQKDRLQRNLYDFAKEAWHVIDPAEFVGGGFAMQAVCDHLQACADGHIRNLIINIPPRFSKSTLVGTLFPAWVWAQNEISPTSGNGVQFLFASYSQTLSLQDSLKCRRLVESEWYTERWGDKVQLQPDQNTKSQFDLISGGRRQTTSVGGSTTGMGGTYLVADDPNNSREANSEAIIQSTLEWWDMAWSTRLNDSKRGCRIIIQQRLNQRDVTGHVLTQDIGNWTHLMLPMRFEPERRIYTVLVPAEYNDGVNDIVWTDPREEEGQLLWPERFGEEEVTILEKTLGPYGAAGQLQQRPVPAGGGIIKRTWWMPWTAPAFPDMEINIGSLDLAYTTKKENDFSAMTCWGIWQDSGESTAIVNRDHHGNVVSRIQKSNQGSEVPKIMMTNAWRARLEFHELVEKIIKTARESKIDILLVEAKGPGISVAQEIRRLVGIEEFSIREINPMDLDKTARLYAVQHLFAEGLIYAPTKVGDPDLFRVWADMVVTEVEEFPKGTHDDLCLVGDTNILMADGSLKRIDQIIVGDEVKTPKGTGKVSAAAMTGIKPIWELFYDNNVLRGTANHPVWANGEWKPLASLCQYDMLETSYLLTDKTSWHSQQNQISMWKQLSSMVSLTGGTLTHLIRRIVGTSQELARDFIGMYGFTTMAQSLTGIKSTTLMETPETMTYPILNAWIAKHTAQNTMMNMSNEQNLINKLPIWRRSEIRPKIGIEAQKGVNGTGKMLTGLLRLKAHLLRTAKAVMKNVANGVASLLLQKVLRNNFVQLRANQPNQNMCVVKHVRFTNTMLPVYNLTVDGEHCYYANGILTHNCDTVSQAINFMRRAGMITRGAERTFELSEAQKFTGNNSAIPLYPV